MVGSKVQGFTAPKSSKGIPLADQFGQAGDYRDEYATKPMTAKDFENIQKRRKSSSP